MQQLSLIVYKYTKWFLAFLIGLMTVITLMEVGARNIFHHSFSWSEELARFILVWVTFIGASVGYKKGELVAIDAVERLPEKVRKPIYMLTQLVSLVFIVFLAYLGYAATFSDTVMRQVASGFRVSMMWPYLSIPLGMTFMFIHALAFLFSPKSFNEEQTL
ncbi:TRAP transporter small permease [Bacillus sp. FJAT-29814]|uniref:TRAP transporter small permease n=1 Tax=Bacillus sp. FJAT-29814 TaxID=1729688 RepID=UPI00082CFD27|nr:TRAP transporter small permease [Bacillus sp. FJAT-29814]